MKLSYVLFQTRLGWMGVLGTPRGLCRLALPQSSPQAVRHLLGDRLGGAQPDAALFGDLAHRLKGYLEGEKAAFDDRLDLTAASPFQGSVWQATRRIPYGHTRSYAWIAREIGKPQAARAVGQALAANPLPILIPCHRVIASDGSLGGFTGGCGVKGFLLGMEASAAGG